jgi:hypothetical protein
MRRSVLLGIVAALSLALGGCETSGFWDRANSVSDRFNDMMTDFSPFGTAKKPLPGERRAVFPEGVPGVQQGVPPELMRANRQALETPAEPPPPAPEPKAKAKKVAKTKAAARPRAAPAEPAEPESSDPPEDGVWPPPPRR